VKSQVLLVVQYNRCRWHNRKSKVFFFTKLQRHFVPPWAASIIRIFTLLTQLIPLYCWQNKEQFREWRPGK